MSIVGDGGPVTSISISLELLLEANVVPKSSTLEAEASIIWLSPTPNSNGKKLEV